MKLKNKIKKDITSTPYFLDLNKDNDYSVYKLMRLMDECILELISLNMLSDKRIKSILSKYKLYTTGVLEILEKNRIFDFIIYYENLLDYILEESVNLEYYETSYNIHRFNTLFANEYE
jgi:hypothetical protein